MHSILLRSILCFAAHKNWRTTGHCMTSNFSAWWIDLTDNARPTSRGSEKNLPSVSSKITVCKRRFLKFEIDNLGNASRTPENPLQSHLHHTPGFCCPGLAKNIRIFDSTKFRCSTSPDNSLHLQAPQMPPEHLMSMEMLLSFGTSVANLSAGISSSRPERTRLRVKGWFTSPGPPAR